MSWARKRARAAMNGKMAATTKVILKTACSRVKVSLLRVNNYVKEFTTLRSQKRLMRDNFLRTSLKVLASFNLKMAVGTKETLKGVKNTAKVQCYSLTETNTLVNGKTTYNTVREFSSRKLKVQSDKDNGKRASALLGFLKLSKLEVENEKTKRMQFININIFF